MSEKFFVTGIGTNVGKTFVSAILCNALNADYWKPIQCGDLENSDSIFIQKYSEAKTFTETYRLKMPASPHLAAKVEGVKIELDKFILPVTENNLIVEGAGGMLVPINEENNLVIDIATKFDLNLIIVSAFYLGSINHTLLTLEVAKQRKLQVSWLIFSGEKNNSTVEIIQKFYPKIKVAFVPEIKNATKDLIQIAAENFRKEYLF